MHQPADTPRPSIYYSYRVFPVLPLDELRARSRAQVVIAGAGPAGMTTALLLKRMGVDSVILESERQVSQGSRAIVFTRRSMEILQQAGVAERVLEQGLPWHAGNSFYRGERVFRMDAPVGDDDRFPPLINLQQQYLEEFLVDACARAGIEIRWGNKIEQVLEHDPVVTLRVDTPAGDYVMEADWLVATDGARSPIRQQYGLKMEGDSYEGRFVIADIRIDLDYPTERLAFFDPSWNPGNTVLMHREPHGIWRIDYQLPPGESPEQALSPASLKERIDAQLAMIGKGGIPWEMDWCSVYSARAMTLPDYRHGHIFFAGDAAHMLPIFGVRGANTAFQDAQNLAWKLALVCRNKAGEALLATYSQERVGAAREIIQEGGRSTRFMTPPTHGFKLLRNATLSLALRHAFVRPLFHWRTSRAHTYASSPLKASTAMAIPGIAIGAVMPNLRLDNGGYLLDHLHPCHHLLIHGPLSVEERQAAGRLQAALDARGMALNILVLEEGGNTGEAASALAGVPSRLPVSAARLRAATGSDAPFVILVRPDQHVAGSWRSLDARCQKQIQGAFDALGSQH